MSSTGAEPYPAAAGEILSALKASFSTPHFIRDSTGHDSERAADALALGMYRSRGREIWGFEFKVSRADWLWELRQREKLNPGFSSATGGLYWCPTPGSSLRESSQSAGVCVCLIKAG